MVIVKLSHGYPPAISGVTLVVQKLARHLVGRGHRVVVITASDHGRPYRTTDQGVELIRIRGLRNRYWSDAPIPWLPAGDLLALLNELKPDLVHTHENAILSTQLLRIRRRLGVPLISSCYYLPGYAPHYVPFGRPVRKLVERWVWWFALRNLNGYDQLIFSTPTHQEMFAEHGLTAPAVAISNGVDVHRYHPPSARSAAEEQRLHLPPRPRILFVSRIARDKKIDVLIRAMAHLQGDFPAHLLLAGRGDDRPRLEKLVRKLGLEQSVHFLGFVPEPAMPALYRAADLFAIASICEVQSIPVLQACATGLPVVAANAGALPELVEDGYNGLLVPPDHPQATAQAIRTILSDPVVAGRMGQASLEIGRRHAEEGSFAAFEALYEAVLAGRPVVGRPVVTRRPAESVAPENGRP